MKRVALLFAVMAFAIVVPASPAFRPPSARALARAVRGPTASAEIANRRPGSIEPQRSRAAVPRSPRAARTGRDVAAPR